MAGHKAYMFLYFIALESVSVIDYRNGRLIVVVAVVSVREEKVGGRSE